jgi:soluble cytochrome b562
MQINSVANTSYSEVQGNDGFKKIKQSLQSLNSALDSGNLSDAKAALAQLQKNAPAQASSDKNPMAAKMEALSKAVDSGDLNGAREAFTDIKKTMSQRPSGTPPKGAFPSDSEQKIDSNRGTIDMLA